MKKAMVAVLSTTMMLSLVGCASGGNNVQTSATPKDTTSTSSGNKVNISFINGFTGGDGPFMTKIVDAFNASQDQYHIEQLQDSDHYTKFKSDDFDMLIIHADWISTYHALDLLSEVSDIYDMAGLSFEEDFHPITQTYAEYEDGVYAFPLDLYADTLFYNKAYIEELPKNYEEMLALRDQLDSKNTGVYPLGLPLTGDVQWVWMTALGQAGCDWVEGEHIKMDTEEICDAFMKIHDMIYVDGLSATGLGDQDHFNTFINESTDKNTVKSALCMSGPWKYTVAQEVLGDDLAIGTLPQLFGENASVPAGGHTFGVSSKVTDAAKREGIAEFMKFAYQPEVMLNWADSGQAPIHLETMDLVKESPEKYPVANVNYGIFDDAVILPAVYNIREQVKYVSGEVWSLVVQTPDLTREALMKELVNATKIAEELSEQ